MFANTNNVGHSASVTDLSVTCLLTEFEKARQTGVLRVLAWLVPHKLLPSQRVQCTPYSHIHKVHVCLAVTCQLHFWQNDGIFYMLLR